MMVLFFIAHSDVCGVWKIEERKINFLSIYFFQSPISGRGGFKLIRDCPTLWTLWSENAWLQGKDYLQTKIQNRVTN